MQIKRGVVGFNNRNEMIISSPGHIYYLNNNSFYNKTLNENDKVFGVIINNKFSICQEFITLKGYYVFGFINEENFNMKKVFIKTIENFEYNLFNPFEAEYSLGEEAIIEF